jgi:hypothetical protein
LETEQKGERFTMVEAPRLPAKPYKPNRLAIVVVGLVLGIMAGVGLNLGLGYVDDRIYSSDLLSHVTGLPVLVGVPMIVTAKDRISYRKRRIAIAVGATVVLMIVAGLIVVKYTMTDFGQV